MTHSTDKDELFHILNKLDKDIHENTANGRSSIRARQRTEQAINRLITQAELKGRIAEARLTIDIVWGHEGRHNRDDPPKEVLDRLNKLEASLKEIV